MLIKLIDSLNCLFSGEADMSSIEFNITLSGNWWQEPTGLYLGYQKQETKKDIQSKSS